MSHCTQWLRFQRSQISRQARQSGAILAESGVPSLERELADVARVILLDPSGSTVHSCLQLANRFDHFVKPWNLADDHTNHPLVIAPEICEHVVGWPEDKCARSRSIQPEVWTAKEHAGVTDTITDQGVVVDRACESLGTHHAMDVVVVPRDSLSLIPKDSTVLVPPPQAMQDHDFVPEGALRHDGCHIGYLK